MSELVSITIATRNRAHLLERCFKSIFNQTYTNYEIVVADDASTDNTKEVIKKYMETHKNIVYVYNPVNKGVAYIKDLCFRNAKGTYIALMDDDDEWTDNKKLEKQVKILSETDNAIVCSGVDLIDENGNVKQKKVSEPKDMFEILLKGNSLIYNSTVLLEGSAMKKAGGYDVKLKRGVDSELFRQIVCEQKRGVYFMDEVTTNIHEYGSDRVTTRMSRKEAAIKIKQNFYCIRKHFGSFIKHPKALLSRLRNVARNVVYLIIGR